MNSGAFSAFVSGMSTSFNVSSDMESHIRDPESQHVKLPNRPPLPGFPSVANALLQIRIVFR